MMKIDGAVNYSSFMQHFHPIEVQSVPVSDLHAAKNVEEVKETPKVAENEGQVASLTPVVNRAAQYDAVNGREALEDIAVDFGQGTSAMDGTIGGFETAGIRQAISDMEKDSVLHEYQYFVGNHRSETIVDNADGVVTRLSDAVA